MIIQSFASKGKGEWYLLWSWSACVGNPVICMAMSIQDLTAGCGANKQTKLMKLKKEPYKYQKTYVIG
jgi:hypothetical protein